MSTLGTFVKVVGHSVTTFYKFEGHLGTFVKKVGHLGTFVKKVGHSH